MTRNLLLIGGGGHCKSVLNSLYENKEFDEIAIIDRQEKVGSFILGTPIIGTDEDLPKLFSEGYKEAFVTIGSVGNPSLRVRLTKELKVIGFSLPNIVDETATVSTYSELSDGIYVGKQAVINADVKVGEGTIINSCALVEHECMIGDFVHLAPRSVLCGGVEVRDRTHIGANSVIRQQVTIGTDVMIGMGSVVLRHMKAGVIAYGNPCKEVSSK
ncbi:acetyltransferase [Amphibacillus cookii]|uniref:acetyltransferase n=1 Tax=Amphibacillus cookii TaxID=767787 RepID=UPI001956B9FF|nr:acetyltransferase [Amphibacillus cookii]MBM7540033.1 sugar O-acyltransferase (sialic acid O-acetyltransferase NeuD family) [Amphibacillus cookii]